MNDEKMVPMVSWWWGFKAKINLWPSTSMMWWVLSASLMIPQSKLLSFLSMFGPKSSRQIWKLWEGQREYQGEIMQVNLYNCWLGSRTMKSTMITLMCISLLIWAQKSWKRLSSKVFSGSSSSWAKSWGMTLWKKFWKPFTLCASHTIRSTRCVHECWLLYCSIKHMF